MAYILNIETATKNCSVAVAREGELVALRELSEESYGHAEKLHVFIEDVLLQANISVTDLSAVAISKGPGSYTGLRIGVSTAKGLCFATDIPLIAVDTLEVLASALTIDQGVLVPMIDARRMEVYSAVFDPSMTMIRDVKAEILTEDSYREIGGTIHVLGDSTEKAKTVLKDPRFVFHDEVRYPSSREMCRLSWQKYQDCAVENLAYFEPFYLKDFIGLK